jgi:dihydroorotate dehydrogenase electron transfer subunit
MNTPKICEIKDIQLETNEIKTITFQHPGKIIPGQFYMIWIPEVDEIPMSVSIIHNDEKGITFRRVGEATNKLFELNKKDKIGIRGPYGNGFKFKGKKILFVGGGTGIAMITPAIEQTMKEGYDVSVIIGAKTKNELFFNQRIKKTGAKLNITTDDGTEGFQGYASELVKQIISNEKFDRIYTCGPETMMKTIHKISKNIPLQASLERHMKCAIGICGQCCIGEGLRVCLEGPVFNNESLDKIPDFGVFKRDVSGKKIDI